MSVSSIVLECVGAANERLKIVINLSSLDEHMVQFDCSWKLCDESDSERVETIEEKVSNILGVERVKAKKFGLTIYKGIAFDWFEDDIFWNVLEILLVDLYPNEDEEEVSKNENGGPKNEVASCHSHSKKTNKSTRKKKEGVN